jgi:hypothetical protein
MQSTTADLKSYTLFPEQEQRTDDKDRTRKFSKAAILGD